MSRTHRRQLPVPEGPGMTRAWRRRLVSRVGAVADAADRLAGVSDAELAGRYTALAADVTAGRRAHDDTKVEAFAYAAEAAARTLGMRPYPVQLLAGLVIADGGVAEMATGEGKTLVATLPAAWAALAGRGCHVMTANEYLAGRDAAWMAPVYAALGLRVGVTARDLGAADRRAAYDADVTYGTVAQFGFDYLGDHLVRDADEIACRRGRHAAVVDEADAAMIDEARTPLIISRPAPARVGDVVRVAAAVDGLVPGLHVDVDEADRTATLTDDGLDLLETRLGVADLYADPVLARACHAAVRAKFLFRRDRDYIVADGQVLIVDERTGRAQPNRRWQDGLHEAIEAREGVEVRPPTDTAAEITVQSLLAGYQRLGGMSGTAATDAAELESVYGTPVAVIPPHRPRIRVDHPDLLFATAADKFAALSADVAARAAAGQPVLVGAPSVADAERLSALLAGAGVDHQLLSAKNHAAEAAIIAQAGRSGTVTIATNMAGRGVDILLGGDPAGLAAEAAAAAGEPGSDAYRAAYDAALAAARDACAADRQAVLAAGGLYVAATARHDSRRVDNQLRGRAGRQGEPGETRSYLSLEDDLVRLFGGDRVAPLLARAGGGDGRPITHRWLTRVVDRAQARVEAVHAEERAETVKYGEVYDHQRDAVYAWRDEVLAADGPTIISSWLARTYRRAYEGLCGRHAPDEFTAAEHAAALDGLFAGRVPDAALGATSVAEAAEAVRAAAVGLLDERFAPVRAAAPDLFDSVVRGVCCDIIDGAWAYQLTELDALRDGISWRAAAQLNPETQFRLDASRLFDEMVDAAHRRVAGLFWQLEIRLSEPGAA